MAQLGSLSQLSEVDIARLLNSDEADSARLDISQKLAAEYAQSHLSEDESHLAEQVFRLLVKDTAIEVRQMLADNLKKSDDAPRDIILTMTTDVDEVALPILESSTVLTEADLVELVTSTENTGRHVAIAGRKDVTEKLAGTLIDHSDAAPVAETLVNNTSAILGQNDFDRILAKHQHSEDVMKAVAKRPKLPPAIVEKVITHVTGALKEELQQKYNITPAFATPQVEKARETATLRLVRRATNADDILKLLVQLHDGGRLTPSILTAALTQGNWLFFTTGIALLANIPRENVEKLLSDNSGNAFKALYNKAKLPPEYFASLRDLIPEVRALQSAEPNLDSEPFAELLLARVDKKPHLVSLIHGIIGE